MADRLALCQALRESQVSRRFYIASCTRQSNAIGALVRRGLGWAPDADDAAKIVARAGRVTAAALAGKPVAEADAAVFELVKLEVVTARLGIEPYAKARAEVEAEMRRTARQLPAFAWAKSIRGLGELAVAIVIGEAGDLSAYATHEKLWKRLGLAPYNGKAGSTWRRQGGLSAEEWTGLGYAPRRRAEIFACLGDPLFRHQTMVAGPYRAVYDARRAHTAVTHPDWTKAHSHNDALRIMTKAVIADLWSAWNAAEMPAAATDDPAVAA